MKLLMVEWDEEDDRAESTWPTTTPQHNVIPSHNLISIIKAIEDASLMPNSPITLVGSEHLNACVMVYVDGVTARLDYFPKHQSDMKAFCDVYRKNSEIWWVEDKLRDTVIKLFPQVTSAEDTNLGCCYFAAFSPYPWPKPTVG
jgi:hypothetical protein